MTAILWREAASHIGARLGNWNDRRNATGGRMAEHPLRWLALDRIARWLYVRPDCGREYGSTPTPKDDNND